MYPAFKACMEMFLCEVFFIFHFVEGLGDVDGGYHRIFWPGISLDIVRNDSAGTISFFFTGRRHHS